MLTITLPGKFHSPHFSERETEVQREVKNKTAPRTPADKTQSRGPQPQSAASKGRYVLWGQFGSFHHCPHRQPPSDEEGERIPNGFPRMMWLGSLQHSKRGKKARTLGSGPVRFQEGHLRFPITGHDLCESPSSRLENGGNCNNYFLCWSAQASVTKHHKLVAQAREV